MQPARIEQRDPGVVLKCLLAATGIIVLLGASTLLVFWTDFSNDLLSEIQESYIRLFNLDLEGNVPSWFSASLLLAAAGLLAWIGSLGRNSKHWYFLAIIFLFLSIDESAVIHEMAIKPIRDIFGGSGLLYYGWIIPAAAFSGLLAILYFPWLKRLPRRVQLLLILSAVLYLGSALGIEAVTGIYDEAYGEGHVVYQLLAIPEEAGEMVGVVLFIYALLTYLAGESVET